MIAEPLNCIPLVRVTLFHSCVAGGQSHHIFDILPFRQQQANSMRLLLLLAFWATLLTLVFASYVHSFFALLDAVDTAASWR